MNIDHDATTRLADIDRVAVRRESVLSIVTDVLDLICRAIRPAVLCTAVVDELALVLSLLARHLFSLLVVLVLKAGIA